MNQAQLQKSNGPLLPIIWKYVTFENKLPCTVNCLRFQSISLRLSENKGTEWVFFPWVSGHWVTNVPAWPNPTKQSAASAPGFRFYSFFSATASGASYWHERWGWAEPEKGQSCKLPGKILMKPELHQPLPFCSTRQQNFPYGYWNHMPLRLPPDHHIATA